MRRYFGLCGLLLSAAFLLSSCLKDEEDETTLYDDTALTSFAISTAKILTHTTTSEGKDSTYYTTNSYLSYYPFSIDHINGLIYNVDSLPYGTEPTRMLVSYATKNNGLAWLENLTGDSVKYLQTTDSIDFSQPRNVRVYASNGSQEYKKYTVTVNIHKEDGDAFAWHKADQTTPAFTSFTAIRLVSLGNSVLLLGSDGTSTVLYEAPTDGASAWENTGLTLGADAYKGATVKGDTLYVLDGITLKAKAIGQGFTTVATVDGISQLLGATHSEMYAYATDGGIMVSTDNGRTWAADQADAAASLLPSASLSLATSAFAYADSTDQALLAGIRSVADYAADANAMVWRKVVEYGAVKERTEWNFIDFDNAANYPLPRLDGLTVLAYGDEFIAFGGKGLGACTASAFDKVYESRDGGLTWKASSKYALPDDFAAEGTTTFAATVDGNNHIWIVSALTGTTWSGKLNKLGWK